MDTDGHGWTRAWPSRAICADTSAGPATQAGNHKFGTHLAAQGSAHTHHHARVMVVARRCAWQTSRPSTGRPCSRRTCSGHPGPERICRCPRRRHSPSGQPLRARGGDAPPWPIILPRAAPAHRRTARPSTRPCTCASWSSCATSPRAGAPGGPSLQPEHTCPVHLRCPHARWIIGQHVDRHLIGDPDSGDFLNMLVQVGRHGNVP
jgi:hypothetical protein